MSSYPSADDYAFALEPTRLAKHLRKDASLLQLVSEGELTFPKGARYSHVANGFFAYIYRVKTAQGEFALRCPRKHFPINSAARYQSLVQFLRTNSDTTYLIEAEHFDNALFVSVGSQGSWFPVQVMRWIPGKTLLEIVAEKVNTGDTKGLRVLAEEWEKLLIAMKTHGVIHGDLHPDNVIVSQDNILRLVDYDTLIVPGFTPENIMEGGMSTYYHPCYQKNNTKRYTTSYVDDFGALNILLSLKILSINPILRSTSEYLLFRVSDLESPTTSRLFMEILHHNDDEIALLANAFFDECCAAIDTGNFRVENFVPVTPAMLLWDHNPACQQLNPSMSNGCKHREEDLPPSVGSTVRRTHGSNPQDTKMPSSAGSSGRRTHSYEPK